MIKIDDKSVQVTLKISANWPKSESNVYTLALFNTVNRTKTTFSVVDTSPNSVLFYTFTTTLSSLPANEYEYTLINVDNEIVATGLIQLGSTATRDIINQNIEYKTYNS